MIKRKLKENIKIYFTQIRIRDEFLCYFVKIFHLIYLMNYKKIFGMNRIVPISSVKKDMHKIWLVKYCFNILQTFSEPAILVAKTNTSKASSTCSLVIYENYTLSIPTSNSQMTCILMINFEVIKFCLNISLKRIFIKMKSPKQYLLNRH